ncbi:MAG: trypsin-like peptidase domain-containing protein [Cycloclasticus sp.]|nr:trypsin-like peptidase domain-containing protein [Cycloclasticus sp.]
MVCQNLYPFKSSNKTLSTRLLFQCAWISCLCLISTSLFATDFSKLFTKVDNAVVVLHTYSSAPDPKNATTTVSLKSLGTGTVISKSGKILTAAHVVQTVDSIHVEFRNGEKILGKVIASEPTADLAVIQLSRLPDNLAVIELGDSDKVKVGQEVVVIGTPYGLEHTLTVGHISARHQPEQLKNPFFQGEFFQTDAAINQGNSGGPVFDSEGKLIGIVSYITTKSGGNEGLGFAVTSNTAKQLLTNDANFWSGLKAIPITGVLAEALNYPLDYGSLVQTVADGSPSKNAGIRGGNLHIKIGDNPILLGGDIIVTVESLQVKGKDNYNKIISAIKKVKKGDAIKVKLYRQGIFRTINVEKP